MSSRSKSLLLGFTAVVETVFATLISWDKGLSLLCPLCMQSLLLHSVDHPTQTTDIIKFERRMTLKLPWTMFVYTDPSSPWNAVCPDLLYIRDFSSWSPDVCTLLGLSSHTSSFFSSNLSQFILHHLPSFETDGHFLDWQFPWKTTPTLLMLISSGWSWKD